MVDILTNAEFVTGELIADDDIKIDGDILPIEELKEMFEVVLDIPTGGEPPAIMEELIADDGAVVDKLEL